MDRRQQQKREGLWVLATSVVLAVRMLATIATILLVIGWAVVAIRDGLVNDFLWPAVSAAAALLVSTYLYTYLRARYPRRGGWLP